MIKAEGGGTLCDSPSFFGSDASGCCSYVVASWVVFQASGMELASGTEVPSGIVVSSGCSRVQKRHFDTVVEQAICL